MIGTFIVALLIGAIVAAAAGTTAGVLAFLGWLTVSLIGAFARGRS